MKPIERIRRILLPMVLITTLIPPVRAAECAHHYVPMREEPSCENAGMTWEQCTLCGDAIHFVTIPELGHDYADWYVLTEPDCTHEGVMARDCIRCGGQEIQPIPHLGHEYVVEVVAPTCTARGYTSHYCPGCGDRFRTDYTDPLGHRYDEGRITKEPTLTAMGRITYTCIGCGDTYQEMIPMLTNPFADIQEEAYYFTPVIWAVNAGITSGVDETHFGPDQLCTRAQVVSFLWRGAGKPNPEDTTHPFSDVKVGSYYEKAVLWAVESGITQGTDNSHFSPDAPCTRGQVVTFLHRFRGCPEPEITTAFPDVTPGTYCYKAVLWAAQREITVGMDGGYFRPNTSCTRGQIVTFLYRDAKNP